MRSLLMMTLLLLLSACQQTPNVSQQERLLFINNQLVDCYGVGPMKCMQVRNNETDAWSLFYQQIDGFNFEAGYNYTLRVRIDTVANPPADGSSLHFTLLDMIAKTAAN